MGNYEAMTKDRRRIVSSMFVGTVVSGALVAGSLTGLAPANATCLSIMGFGGGEDSDCQSSFGNIAVAFGEGAQASSVGGLLNFAVTVGAGSLAATGVPLPGENPLPNIGNVALNIGEESSAVAAGVVNLALNVGARGNSVAALGVLNSALSSAGSGNELVSAGFFNNTTNFWGDDNTLLSASTGIGNVAFNGFGSGNTAVAGPGPLAIAGAIFVDGQSGPAAITNSNFGIEVRTPFNVATPEDPDPVSTLAVNNTGSKLSGPAAKTGKQLGSSLKKVKANVKSFNDNVKKALGLKKKKTTEAAD